jgi:protease-4
VSNLLDKLGVKINEIKSGPLKAEPGALKPAPPEALEVTREMIADGQQWFNGLVETRRKIALDQVPGLTDGRIYSGRMALQHKLIDQIGAEADAVAWMVKERGVPDGLKVVDWKPKDDFPFPFGGQGASVLDWAARALGLPAAPTRLQTLGLDGLLSVWHPSEN